jgi:8-oxo-dGTP pyrophosphatase MutT (NUDIX family)
MAKKRQPTSDKKARQYAAIPVRVRERGKAEVLLLTSRGKRRWGIPKGWPMPKRSPGETARREAFEEAGLKGRIHDRPLGRYRYTKNLGSELGKITVKVFLLHVDRQLRHWPEKGERKTKWFSPDRAVSLIADRRLARLLRRAAKLAGAEN